MLRKTRLFVAACLCAGLWSSAALAKELKVPSRYSSIEAAVKAARNGDTILVAPGTYKVGKMNLNKKITLASNYIKSKNEKDIKETIIDGSSAGKAWLRITAKDSKVIGLTMLGGKKHSISIECPYAEVLNCRIIKGEDQLSFEGGGGRVAYCYFDQAGDDSVDADDSVDYIVEYCIFDNVKQDANETRLQPKSGNLTTHIFRYNTILRAGESGIQLIDYKGDCKRQFQIYGNVFINCKGAGVSITNGTTNENYKGSEMVENVAVYNNTFHNCNYGMTMGPNVTVVNNIFIGCSKGIGKSHYVSGGGKSMIDYNLFYKNKTDYDSGLKMGSKLFKVDSGSRTQEH
jgi:hypothetical protein